MEAREAATIAHRNQRRLLLSRRTGRETSRRPARESSAPDEKQPPTSV
jgi:hypothetical protein